MVLMPFIFLLFSGWKLTVNNGFILFFLFGLNSLALMFKVDVFSYLQIVIGEEGSDFNIMSFCTFWGAWNKISSYSGW
jgi:hypothetical protein